MLSHFKRTMIAVTAVAALGAEGCAEMEMSAADVATITKAQTTADNALAIAREVQNSAVRATSLARNAAETARRAAADAAAAAAAANQAAAAAQAAAAMAERATMDLMRK